MVSLLAIALSAGCTSSADGPAVRTMRAGNLRVTSSCGASALNEVKASDRAVPSWILRQGSAVKVSSLCDDTTLTFTYGTEVGDDKARKLKVWMCRNGQWTSSTPDSVVLPRREVVVVLDRPYGDFILG